MRSVDWALINTETLDVLRTASSQGVLETICDHMRSQTLALGGNPDRYRVMEMRRAEMGDVLYERAIDVRWQEAQRRVSQRTRDIGHLPISALR